MIENTREEIDRHRESVLSLLHQVISESKATTWDEFQADEQQKERFFSQLQEIGEASRELSDITDMSDTEYERDLFIRLSTLRNARFNQEAEMGTQQIWSIVVNDLPEIEEELSQSFNEGRNVEK